MKSEDVQEALRGLRAILQLYPGYSIDEIVRDVKRLKKAESVGTRPGASSITTGEVSKELDQQLVSAIDDFVNRLDSLSITEIEKELKSDQLFPSMPYLRYFAEKVGVDVGSRQARASTIHTIKAFFDRSRIESTMARRTE